MILRISRGKTKTDSPVNPFKLSVADENIFYTISAGERESCYVIDGILYNEFIETELHSTNTHGYLELVFAITYLLGTNFAPRIAKFEEHRLFFHGRNYYPRSG